MVADGEGGNESLVIVASVLVSFARSGSAQERGQHKAHGLTGGAPRLDRRRSPVSVSIVFIYFFPSAGRRAQVRTRTRGHSATVPGGLFLNPTGSLPRDSLFLLFSLPPSLPSFLPFQSHPTHHIDFSCRPRAPVCHFSYYLPSLVFLPSFFCHGHLTAS
jgi:hypothetical protein